MLLWKWWCLGLLVCSAFDNYCISIWSMWVEWATLACIDTAVVRSWISCGRRTSSDAWCRKELLKELTNTSLLKLLTINAVFHSNPPTRLMCCPLPATNPSISPQSQRLLVDTCAPSVSKLSTHSPPSTSSPHFHSLDCLLSHSDISEGGWYAWAWDTLLTASSCISAAKNQRERGAVPTYLLV